MAFEIPIDLDYFDHPKALHLIEILRKPEADVYPIRLWRWAAKYARDGVIPADTSVMERGVRWKGKAGVLHAALVTAGFLNKDGLTIHDWQEYVGRAIMLYESKKKKQRDIYDKMRGIIPEDGRKIVGILPEECRKTSGISRPTPDTPEAPDTPDTQDRGERGPIGGPKDPPVSASQGGDGVSKAPPDVAQGPETPQGPPESTGPKQDRKDPLRSLKKRAKDRKVYAASPKQLDEILTSWEARDGEVSVMAALDAGVGQDILKLFDASGKGPGPYRPPKPRTNPCGMCDGTGKVADLAKSTAIQTVLKPCGTCNGTGKGKV